MRNFIETRMYDIFDDFRESLACYNCYCELKNLRFNSNNIPDYSKPILQQFYLLRYFPAYLVEYYDIYNTIRDEKFISTPYDVLSIGAGCGLDYFGLNYALQGEGLSVSDYVYYTGIDQIDWGYRDTLDNTDCHFINRDINELSCLDADYNIIIFPKSIGEFTKAGFTRLEKIFRVSDFRTDRLVLISSLRELNANTDVNRLTSIATILEEIHGFKCLDDKKAYTHYRENAGLRTYFSDFIYPDEILSYIKSLSFRCPVRMGNGGVSCENECLAMNRSPILRTSHIKYQILKLQR